MSPLAHNTGALRPSRRRFGRRYIALGAFISLVTNGFATDIVWTGASSNDWRANANWAGNSQPGTNDNAVFGGAFTNQPNLTGNKTVGGVWMRNGNTQNITVSGIGAELTLQGNTINGVSGRGLLIDNTDAFTLTFLCNLKVGTNQSWINSSANLVTASGALDTNGRALTIGGSGAFLLSGIISGTGSLTKSDGGTLTLSGVNTYTGGTTINGGTLIVNSATSLGAVTSGLTIDAGTLEIAAGYSSSRAIAITSATSTFKVNSGQTFTVLGTITGAGSLNKTGAGTMILSAAESYSGSTNVSDGILRLGASDRIPNASALNVSGGTFDLQTFADTVGTVTLSGGSITGTATAALTGSSYALQNGSVSAVLAGSGTLTKSTAGTITLTGANTLTGATTVSGGTLILAASTGSALANTSSVTVNSGGTLLLGAGNQINNAADITLAGGTFAKGNFSEGSASAAGVGALTLTASGSRLDFGNGTVGTLAFTSFTPGAFTLQIDNWTGTANTVGNAGTDRLIFNASQSPANLLLFQFAGYAAGATQFDLGNGFYEIVPVTPVPEPATWLAGALVAAALAYGRRARVRPYCLRTSFPSRRRCV